MLDPSLLSSKLNLNVLTPFKLSKNATRSSISAFGLVEKDRLIFWSSILIPSASRCSYPSPKFANSTLGVLDLLSPLSGCTGAENPVIFPLSALYIPNSIFY